jgi:hypothetical protein
MTAWSLARDVAPVVGGVVVTLAVGRFVACALNTVREPAVDRVYREAFGQKSPPILGTMERLLFFAAIWLAQSGALVAWLGFKVAAKWAAWQHIVQLPDDFGPQDSITEQVKTRDTIASYILSRFLIGTLYNVLAGALGAGVAWFLERLVKEGVYL